MTVTEFKAFLDGMDVKDAPTPEQWARIVKKVETLEGHGGGAPLPILPVDLDRPQEYLWTSGDTGDVQPPHPYTRCFSMETTQ